MEKPQIAKHVFKVSSKEFITPHYIRIRLQGDGTSDFAVCSLGANNKIFIPPVGTKEVQFAEFNASKGEWVMPDEQFKPLVRTYTHRQIDVENKEITIDFVNHGDTGPASAWARAAEKGDELGVAMKLRASELYPSADWYFLIGDATAIPVLCSILESLPAEAKGHCIIEVYGQEDIHPEVTHPGFTIQWVFNADAVQGSNLPEQVAAVDIPQVEKRFAYIACEYQSVRRLRSYFKNELEWGNKEFYAFAYWKAGVAEDQSAQDRREEKEN